MEKKLILYKQEAYSGQCVLCALNNVLQKSKETAYKCSDFVEEVEEIATTLSHGNKNIKIDIYNHLCTKQTNPLCSQKGWSFTVVLEILKKENIPFRLVEPVTSWSPSMQGRFLIYTHLKKHKDSHHAIAIINGNLLDSIKKHAINLLEPNGLEKFNSEYGVQKIWEII